MAYSGRYVPKNASKYLGDPTQVFFRSLWERKVMVDLDEHPEVVGWSSEEIIIPYISPVDMKPHRYFVDFLVKTKSQNGIVETTLIEVKPKHQTKPPEIKKKRTRKYLTEIATWGVNQAKWAAATKYCDDRGWKFKIITEDHLFGGKR